MRGAELYDDSLVIVTADHGVTFERRTDAREPVPRTLDDILYAPLFVKLPHQDEGRIDDSNVMAIDVVPTVAELLGRRADVGHRRGGTRIAGDLGAQEPRSSGTTSDSPSSPAGRRRRVRRRGDVSAPADRWIGPLDDPDDPLAALDELLDSGGMIGSDLDDARRDDLLTIEIDQLDELRRPPDDGAPLGVVTGRVEGAPPDAEVVLAVDGTVVAGSKLAVDSDGVEGRFAMLLPAGVSRAENEIRAAVVVDGGVIELDLR